MYMLVALTTAGGQTIDVHPPRKPVEINGTIKQLNYSPRGTVDGFVLDNGQVVLVPPGGHLTFTVGQKITGEAVEAPAAPTGAVKILEATKLNGQELRPMGPPPGGGGGKGPPHDGGGPQGGGGPPQGGPQD